MKKTEINLVNYLLDPHCWGYDKGGSVHYACHDHAFNPCYSDDTCGTCGGGACCDGEGEYPRKYVEPEHFYLERGNVYGDTLRLSKFPFPEKITLGLIDAIRNGDHYYEDDENIYNIWDEVSLPAEKYFEERTVKFFNTLRELYTM